MRVTTESQMSREIAATLISAAMLAAVFIVASRLDGSSDSASGTVTVFGVELARDASDGDVAAASEALNRGMRTTLFRKLGITETALAAARERVLEQEMISGEQLERQILQASELVVHLDAASAQLPDRRVGDPEDRSEVIAGLDLPAGYDTTVLHNLLNLEPEFRAGLVADLKRWASSSVEDLRAELRPQLWPLTEYPALQNLICERAIDAELGVPGRSGVRRLGTNVPCDLKSRHYVERLAMHELEGEPALLSKVMRVLSLVQTGR